MARNSVTHQLGMVMTSGGAPPRIAVRYFE